MQVSWNDGDGDETNGSDGAPSIMSLTITADPGSCRRFTPQTITVGPGADPNALNNIVQSDSHVGDMLVKLKNLGLDPKNISITDSNALSFTTNGQYYGVAATSDAGTSAPKWDSQGVNEAVNDTLNIGFTQNSDEILFHELAHLLFRSSSSPDFLSVPSATDPNRYQSVTIDNVKYTFDLSTPDGYNAYEHVWVHNLMVQTLGEDKTGSLFSLSAASSVTDATTGQAVTPPTGQQIVTTANNKAKTVLSATLVMPANAIPTAGAQCQTATGAVVPAASLPPGEPRLIPEFANPDYAFFTSATYAYPPPT